MPEFSRNGKPVVPRPEVGDVWAIETEKSISEFIIPSIILSKAATDSWSVMFNDGNGRHDIISPHSVDLSQRLENAHPSHFVYAEVLVTDADAKPKMTHDRKVQQKMSCWVDPAELLANEDIEDEVAAAPPLKTASKKRSRRVSASSS